MQTYSCSCRKQLSEPRCKYLKQSHHKNAFCSKLLKQYVQYNKALNEKGKKKIESNLSWKYYFFIYELFFQSQLSSPLSLLQSACCRDVTDRTFLYSWVEICSHLGPCCCTFLYTRCCYNNNVKRKFLQYDLQENTTFIALDFALKQGETNKRNWQRYHSVDKLLNTT